jgi:pyruvate formate lyase activating enzyme
VAKGTIFNIEEFAVHDGPGIRKLVFFKGCPLSCTWCHNPEGISFQKEMMFTSAACKHCLKCEEPCTHAECAGFGYCVKVCPLQLRRIVGNQYEASVLARKLLKGKDVLMNSGGGITISGGEPLAQPEFLFDLISHLKPVHVAIETSGYAKPEVFNRMVELVDLVLMDIKQTDNVIHKKYTGVDNMQILENLQFLCHSNTPFLIRIPLIPGVNDTLKNMEKTAFLLKDAKTLLGVEMLPYHQTAPAKYAMVMKEFKPDFDTSLKINTWLKPFEKYNIKVSVL